MGQAKLRGNKEERIRQGIILKQMRDSIAAWRINELLDRDYRKYVDNTKKALKKPLTRSEIVNRMSEVNYV
jgi:hypothetical protein